MTNKTAFDKISKLIRKAENETCSQVRVPVELLKEILVESNKLEIDIAEARHDLAEYRWIPVTERMPKEMEAVEIWLKYAKISITAFWMRNGDVAEGFVWVVSEFERNRCYVGDVSHWRKLQPPEEGEQG